jgi:hypothetical protein
MIPRILSNGTIDDLDGPEAVRGFAGGEQDGDHQDEELVATLVGGAEVALSDDECRRNDRRDLNLKTTISFPDQTPHNPPLHV